MYANTFGAGSNNEWFSPSASMPMISSFGAQAPATAAIQSFGQQQAAPAVTPALGGTSPAGASSGFGFNMDTGKLLLGGLQTIGSIWNAWESQKLAKKQFAFQKDVTETNLRNQIQAYNTTLEDRGRSRAHTEGQDAATAQAYVDNNRLKR